MAAYWYVGAQNASLGPVELEELAELARQGAVQPTTLIWTEGMAEWTPAGSVAALTALLGAPPPPLPGGPPRPPGAVPSYRTAPVGELPAGRLFSAIETFQFFGRTLLVWLGNIFVVPSPWTGTMFWKYLGESTRLPNGTPFAFEGQWRDIWWVFVLQALLTYSSAATGDKGFLAIVGALVLPYLVLRWFCEKLRIGPGGPFLAFRGEFVPYLGWMALAFVSLFTIIGWAWVAQYYLDWVCRNVAGPVRFSFKGTGFEILWRGFATFLACCFIIPIPWALAWMNRWFVSQIEATTAPAA